MTAAEKNLQARLTAIQSASAGLVKAAHKLWAQELAAGRKPVAEKNLTAALDEIGRSRTQLTLAAQDAYVAELDAAVADDELRDILAEAITEPELRPTVTNAAGAHVAPLTNGFLRTVIPAPEPLTDCVTPEPEGLTELGDKVEIIECDDPGNAHQGLTGRVGMFGDGGDASVLLGATGTYCHAKAWRRLDPSDLVAAGYAEYRGPVTP
jgi:hypothetical protein